MERRKLILCAALCALQAGDFFSTRWLLAHGGIETNRMIQVLGLGTAKLMALVIILIFIRRSTRFRRMAIVATIYALVVGWNVGMVAIAMGRAIRK